jgi:hypothetical protein
MQAIACLPEGATGFWGAEAPIMACFLRMFYIRQEPRSLLRASSLHQDELLDM